MIAVKFGVNLILVISLSLIIGKNCFVVNPFVVRSHCVCHLAFSGLSLVELFRF
jgi:hypothetical protein